MNVPLLYFEGTGRSPQRLGLAHPSISPYGAYATADDSLVLISIQNEREWAAFCERVLGDCVAPAGRRVRLEQRPRRQPACVDERVGAALGRLTRDEAAARLKAAGTAYGFVNTLADLATHPALVRTEVETPAGTARIVAPPVLIDGEVRALGPVPAVGEHDARIREEFRAPH